MSEEFRRHADECVQMANLTQDECDRRSWLRLAEGWQRMNQTARRLCPDEFRAQEYERGTRQPPSWARH